MKIALIEPFYSGSHKSWADSLKKYSAHKITIISLKGIFWKWRMHGGAISISEKFLREFSNSKPDLIVATDMLNLPVFLSLTKKITYDIPIILYFHENQITYPWSSQDIDVIKKRDHHYGFINYSSALASDKILFNSFFHKNSFENAITKFLKQFPDYNDLHNVDILKSKSQVAYLGLELNQLDCPYNNCSEFKNTPPIILWNHRWEYDKNPTLFFNTLTNIKKKGYEFKLIIIGEQFDTEMEIFTFAREYFKNDIIHFGYCESVKEYKNYLWMADILPVTSIQEFFGISIMEAAYCNTLPILPNELTYPELFNYNENEKIFYNNKQEFEEKLIDAILNNQKSSTNKYKKIASNYDWENIINIYDNIFDELVTA